MKDRSQRTQRKTSINKETVSVRKGERKNAKQKYENRK